MVFPCYFLHISSGNKKTVYIFFEEFLKTKRLRLLLEIQPQNLGSSSELVHRTGNLDLRIIIKNPRFKVG